MAAGGRYPRGDGYESYDYTYDYGHDSTGSDSFVSESWMTSCPTSSNGGAKHMGRGRDSHGPHDRMDRYGVPKPYRGYGSQRGHPPPSGWRDAAQGGYRGHFRPPPANRGSGGPMPPLGPATSPERSGFHSLKAFTANSYFGGGFKQKSKKLWRENKRRIKGGPPVKKARASAGEDVAKGEESERERDGDHEGERTRATSEGGDKQEKAAEEAGGGETDQKQMMTEKQQEDQSRRLRDRMVDRIQFVCSLCKFRTFYNDEMTSHMQSEFHKELFCYLGDRMPKAAADFLQEYIIYKNKKTEERCKAVKDLSAKIQQIYRDQDITHDLGMEHFVKKIETAHCAACDVFIPMNYRALREHIRAPLHNQNRRHMMENSKKTALTVARSILDNEQISQKLDCYMKGQNPFINDQTKVTASANSGLDISDSGMDVATEGQEPVTTTDNLAGAEQEPLAGSTSSSSANVQNTEGVADVSSQISVT